MTQASSSSISASHCNTAAGSRRALVGGALGNALEWYEFAIYAYMAPIIGPLFFASASPGVSVLAAFSVYALAFFVRPVGAIVFGRLTDRAGRQSALVVIIALMTLSTTLIGLLPTYHSVGLWAPVLLVMLRIVQGLCSGGELGGAVALMVESAPYHRRGLYGSWSFGSTVLGYVLGGAVATALAMSFTAAELSSYAWRIGFLIAAPMGLVILYLRFFIEETQYFQQAARQPEAAAAPVQRRELLRTLLVAIGVVVVWNAVGHTFMVGMPTFLSQFYDMSLELSFLVSLVTGLTAALTMPLFGALSDRIGRRPLLVAAALATALGSYPLYTLLGTSTALSLVALVFAGLIIGMLGGPMPALLCEQFPTRSRATGVALAYALSVALFGGAAPFITTWIAQASGTPFAASFYTAFCGVISLIALFLLPADSHQHTMPH